MFVFLQYFVHCSKALTHILISDHTQVWIHHMDLPGGGGVFGTVPETTSCHQLVQCNKTDIALHSTIVAKCMFQILGHTFIMQTASLSMLKSAW